VVLKHRVDDSHRLVDGSTMGVCWGRGVAAVMPVSFTVVVVFSCCRRGVLHLLGAVPHPETRVDVRQQCRRR